MVLEVAIFPWDFENDDAVTKKQKRLAESKIWQIIMHSLTEFPWYCIRPQSMWTVAHILDFDVPCIRCLCQILYADTLAPTSTGALQRNDWQPVVVGAWCIGVSCLAVDPPVLRCRRSRSESLSSASRGTRFRIFPSQALGKGSTAAPKCVRRTTNQ